jgi:malonate-semialdehyde dehydrogenase (acetylating)/methylmalonate-semialdehyde dehydrogenase
MKTVPLWINGKSVESKSGRFGDVFDPALGEATKQVGFADASEIAATIEAAKAAFPA